MFDKQPFDWWLMKIEDCKKLRKEQVRLIGIALHMFIFKWLPIHQKFIQLLLMKVLLNMFKAIMKIGAQWIVYSMVPLHDRGVAEWKIK